MRCGSKENGPETSNLFSTCRPRILFEDISGDSHHSHRWPPALGGRQPLSYGDSVGYWEGDTLKMDATNLSDDTRFVMPDTSTPDAMRVTERLWRDGANLVWQAIVSDPNVLTRPWTMPARAVKP
jgi:hypothetical protein